MKWIKVGTEAKLGQEELSVTSCFGVEASRASGQTFMWTSQGAHHPGTAIFHVITTEGI